MSTNTVNKIKKTNNYSWNRSYVSLLSEKGKSDLEGLINVFYLLEEFMEAKEEYDGEKTIPALRLKSLFEILTHRLVMINDGLFEPGGIFSQCDIVAGLKLARDRGVNGVQEIIDNLADK
ncbi:hypothetical protein GR27_003111 [Salmonella enterica subsp. enterica]|nr:hypothetical protein [Salmonella enterica subsp. salamae]ECI5144359.1 hypothetical protein [Salmonella enterica subsp. salamae]EDW1163278.1 hypothetical protein [Salmonella enterica subsp. enterica]HAK7670195.1 hypothetical protein [Salmonella enterica]HAK7992764.1 hypothetical protein [Salmonella enterica]